MDYLKRKWGNQNMERKIQLMETYVNIEFGNSPFLKLDKGLQIPYSLNRGNNNR